VKAPVQFPSRPGISPELKDLLTCLLHKVGEASICSCSCQAVCVGATLLRLLLLPPANQPASQFCGQPDACLLTHVLTARPLLPFRCLQDPQQRLGALAGADEVKQHPWFAGINWAMGRADQAKAEAAEQLTNTTARASSVRANDKVKMGCFCFF
jgi:hypothetical protein